MHPALLARLRAAVKDSDALEKLGAELADGATARLESSTRAAVIVAPPIGAPTLVVGGEDPCVVIWLMLDPLDVDSKQTTFCRGSDAHLNMTKLYKWTGSATPPTHTPLPAKIEEEEQEDARESGAVVLQTVG